MDEMQPIYCSMCSDTRIVWYCQGLRTPGPPRTHLMTPSTPLVSPAAAGVPPDANKSDEAYLRIEELIPFKDLAPGQLVSEAMLARLTGFGRTPVREALQRLAREGMVEVHPGRGNLVAPISVEAQLDLLEIR